MAKTKRLWCSRRLDVIDSVVLPIRVLFKKLFGLFKELFGLFKEFFSLDIRLTLFKEFFDSDSTSEILLTPTPQS